MVDTGAGPVRRTSSHQTGCKLIHVRLADQDRTGIERLLNGACSSLRHVGKGRTSSGSGKSSYVNVVFHRERDAVERPIGRPHLKFASTLQSSLFRNKVDPDMVLPRSLDPVIDQANDILGTRGSRLILP